jgi:hypothetical protein
LKLQLRLARVYAEALEAGARYVEGMGRLIARRDIGRKPLNAQVVAELRRASQDDKRLTDELASAIQTAAAEQHPLLLAEAILTRSVVFTYRIVNRLCILAMLQGKFPSIPAAAAEDMEKQIKAALSIFERAGCLEGGIRTKLLLADWYDMTGRTEDARNLAVAVHGIAHALGYARHVSHAEEHVKGSTGYRRLRAHFESPRDHDADLAAASDRDLDDFAAYGLSIADIPAERLPMFRRDVGSWRDIARERLHWCRYIDLHQDQRHTLSPATSYVFDPVRACVCEKHGYRSNVTDSDWETLIMAFKNAYCAECPDRSPKVPQPPAP